jgi:hypothetical protein
MAPAASIFRATTLRDSSQLNLANAATRDGEAHCAARCPTQSEGERNVIADEANSTVTRCGRNSSIEFASGLQKTVERLG